MTDNVGLTKSQTAYDRIKIKIGYNRERLKQWLSSRDQASGNFTGNDQTSTGGRGHEERRR
jgi:hypothetical protein